MRHEVEQTDSDEEEVPEGKPRGIGSRLKLLEEMLIEVTVVLGMPEKMNEGEQGRYDMARARLLSRVAILRETHHGR